MKVKNILIIGGDPRQNEKTKIQLEKQGINVTIFAHPDEVLEKKPIYDVAFVDFTANNLGEIELISQLQEHNPDAKHFLITGYATPHHVISALKLNPEDHLSCVEEKEKNPNIDDEKEGEPKLGHPQTITRQLNQKLAEKIEELTTLYSISEAFNGIEAESSLYESLARLAKTVTHADSAVFYLFDPERNKVIFQAACNLDNLPCANEEIEVNPTILKTILSYPSPLILTSSNPINFCQLQCELCRSKALIGAPLYVRDELFGIVVARRAESKGFGQKERSYLAALLKKAALAIENIALYENLYLNMVNTLHSLVTTLEAKDPYTQQHSLRVTRYALLMAENLDCSTREIEAIKFSAILHDIGKIGVSDAILQKPRRLLPEEFEQIKKHPLIGEKILAPLGLEPEERAIIRNHHERWDGKGYPDGLQGREIPFLARIVSLADAFDAMTSNRPYRRAMRPQEAVKEIIKSSDKQLDGRVVKAFLKLFVEGQIERILNAKEGETISIV